MKHCGKNGKISFTFKLASIVLRNTEEVATIIGPWKKRKKCKQLFFFLKKWRKWNQWIAHRFHRDWKDPRWKIHDESFRAMRSKNGSDLGKYSQWINEPRTSRSCSSADLKQRRHRVSATLLEDEVNKIGWRMWKNTPDELPRKPLFGTPSKKKTFPVPSYSSRNTMFGV